MSMLGAALNGVILMGSTVLPIGSCCVLLTQGKQSSGCCSTAAGCSSAA
jgi:hypothetical protein